MFRYAKLHLKISILLLLVFVISGCSNPFGKTSAVNSDDWEKDVLLASDCGQDGLACCAAPKDPCLFGQQCCSDPANPKLNYCSNDCTLGKKNSFCRAEEPKCDTGFACSDGRCLECGKEKEPCCYGDAKCDSQYVCRNEKCETCGLPGNTCCSGKEACAGQEKKGEGRTECRSDNLCAFCGNGGLVSCLSSPACNPGNLLNNDTCFKCGELNSPCCQVNDINSFICNPEKNLICELGFCTEKK